MNSKNPKGMQEQYMEQFIHDVSNQNKKLSKEEKKYIKYSKKFKERFGREPYIVEPGGTREQTIEAMKKCLEEDEDILDEILFLQNEVIY